MTIETALNRSLPRCDKRIPANALHHLLLPFQVVSVGGDSSFPGKGRIVSQPVQQPPGEQNVQPPQQQQPPPQPPVQQEQPRGPVIVHAQQNDGQLAHQFAAFAQNMENTLRGLPEQLVNSLRESTPQQPQQPQQQPPQQSAQQTQTQQHTQQPPAVQAQQTAAERAPSWRTRLQNAWFGTGAR